MLRGVYLYRRFDCFYSDEGQTKRRSFILGHIYDLSHYLISFLFFFFALSASLLISIYKLFSCSCIKMHKFCCKKSQDNFEALSPIISGFYVKWRQRHFIPTRSFFGGVPINVCSTLKYAVGRLGGF